MLVASGTFGTGPVPVAAGVTAPSAEVVRVTNPEDPAEAGEAVEALGALATGGLTGVVDDTTTPELFPVPPSLSNPGTPAFI